MAAWLIGADHVGSIGEIGLLILSLSFALFVAAVLWLAYVAIEPFLRRHWPDSLISWMRLTTDSFETPSWRLTCWQAWPQAACSSASPSRNADTCVNAGDGAAT